MHLIQLYKVRRRFASSRVRNNILLQNALRDVHNGGDTMTFLRRVAFSFETFINNNLNYAHMNEPQRGINKQCYLLINKTNYVT